MEEHHAVDDQSHYEISLTAGQAFVAFVLLLLSLAASFAFGLMLGKGRTDERLVVQKELPVISEAAVLPRKNDARIVELGVNDDDFRAPAPQKESSSQPVAVITEEPEAAAAPVGSMPLADPPATETHAGIVASGAAVAATPEETPAIPHYAQLLSTSDQKAAEAVAARLIDAGFLSSYVERGQNEKGPVFRVRVRFSSEQEARAAESKLREFSKEVWITKR